MAEDVPLSGGNSAASVVRRGDTVRKPATPYDTATTALLDCLTEAGVMGVPRALGIDGQGRRILSWVPGDTAFPDNLWSVDIAMTSAAKRLRAVHDASVPLVGATRPWAYSYPDRSQHQVICHNDFAPYNMAFDTNGAVAGIFDFDLAGPGPRLRDLAYLAWWMVPFGRQDPNMARMTDQDIAAGSKRLQKLCAAYDHPADVALIDMVSEVLHHMRNPDAAKAMIGQDAADRLIAGGHFDHWARAHTDFSTLKPQIMANLGRHAAC